MFLLFLSVVVLMTGHVTGQTEPKRCCFPWQFAGNVSYTGTLSAKNYFFPEEKEEVTGNGTWSYDFYLDRTSLFFQETSRGGINNITYGKQSIKHWSRQVFFGR